MPKDKLVDLSEELSSLSLKMSEGENTLKKTISAYFENCKIKSVDNIKRLDAEIAVKGKDSGLFGWLKKIFGFGKSNKNKITGRSEADGVFETVDGNIKESYVSSCQEESMHNKMKKAGYRSVVENGEVEGKLEKDKTADVQKNQ